MRNLSIIASLLLGTAAIAQSKPDQPSLAFSVSSTAVQVASMPQYATWSDKIAKDGHYVGTFDDPNDQFRCDVVSYLDSYARNALYSDITSFTIVCTKKRDPQHEVQSSQP